MFENFYGVEPELGVSVIRRRESLVSEDQTAEKSMSLVDNIIGPSGGYLPPVKLQYSIDNSEEEDLLLRVQPGEDGKVIELKPRAQ